jgi:uncharacterized protein YukE
MAGGDGYEVDPAALREYARRSCDIAEKLAEIRRRWAGATELSGDACGYTELRRGYETMQDAWFTELGVYIDILKQLCDGLGAAASGYSSADQRAARRVNGVGAG